MNNKQKYFSSYYQQNKKKMLAKHKLWILRNKEKMKKWYQENKEKILVKHKLWILRNKNKILAEKKRWRERNKNNLIEKQKQKARRKANFKISIEGVVCSDCKKEQAVHRHHEDYDRPLDVVLLCDNCHKKRHKSVEDFETTTITKEKIRNGFTYSTKENTSPTAFAD